VIGFVVDREVYVLSSGGREEENGKRRKTKKRIHKYCLPGYLKGVYARMYLLNRMTVALRMIHTTM